MTRPQLKPAAFRVAENHDAGTSIDNRITGRCPAARGVGATQVVMPQHYDQHYWAGRVGQLGIGTAHAPATPTTASLMSALQQALQPDVAARAASIASAMHTLEGRGAQIAAQCLINAATQN